MGCYGRLSYERVCLRQLKKRIEWLRTTKGCLQLCWEAAMTVLGSFMLFLQVFLCLYLSSDWFYVVFNFFVMVFKFDSYVRIWTLRLCGWVSRSSLWGVECYAGRLLCALVCEYLEWAQLDHTLKVYQPECNLVIK